MHLKTNAYHLAPYRKIQFAFLHIFKNLFPKFQVEIIYDFFCVDQMKNQINFFFSALCVKGSYEGLTSSLITIWPDLLSDILAS